MNRTSPVVLETTKVREVVGIFHSRSSLQAAIDDLLLSGFDRADLDLVGSVAQLRKALSKSSISLDELTSGKGVPKGAPVGREDLALVQAITVGVFSFVAAAGAAAIVIGSHGGTVLAVIAAALAGCTAGALSGYVFARRFKPKDIIVLDDRLKDDGVMLWVRVDSPDRETKARQILLANDAESIRAFEAEIAKTTEDIPLSRFRPDPFIPVHLGEP
jgi:hypothetical protein